jgi:hypothetical protein
MTAIEITTNNTVYRSGFKNSMLKTITVVISVTKVAANNVFAKFASGSLVSSRTDYTTANEVVESAIPAINAASMFHPATK